VPEGLSQFITAVFSHGAVTWFHVPAEKTTARLVYPSLSHPRQHRGFQAMGTDVFQLSLPEPLSAEKLAQPLGSLRCRQPAT
jgi:hypothetical protein